MRARADGADLQVSVSDRGLGVPPELVPVLFDPYGRKKVAGEKLQARLGLGLYLAKGLIEAHGGTLSAETQVGKGSTFLFTLPAIRG
jgi:signal transduction histidine kinase